MMRCALSLGMAIWVAGCLSGSQAVKKPNQEGALQTGKAELRLDVGVDGERLPFTVYTYRPAGLGLDAKVLMVVHGMSRTAEKYRDRLAAPAEQYGYILVAPHFSKEDFSGFRRFAMGNLYSATGSRKPEQNSAFAVLERVFRILRRDHGLTAETYDLFGHSAGGQFVHRMVLFGQVHAARHIVAANAGTYTMPDDTIPLPFGISDANLGPDHLKRVLTRPMMIMAGEDDTDPNHRSLNRSSGALAQGPHRFARAQAFVKQARKTAAALGMESRWEFRGVPNSAHNGKRMGAAAAAYFAESDRRP